METMCQKAGKAMFPIKSAKGMLLGVAVLLNATTATKLLEQEVLGRN